MPKILFPTDFSETADNAFVYALNVADKLGASITTVHAYHLPYVQAVHLPHTLKQVYDSIIIEEFENYKDHVPHLREIAAQHSLSRVPVNHSMVESGPNVTKVILEIAGRDNMDMIIMGTTGTSGLREIFLGSVAAELLENAPCPVLAVPRNAVFDGTIDKIAMTTEFAETEKDTLKHVLEFAGRFDADVYVVHVDVAHTEEYAHRMDVFKQEFKAHENVYFKVVDDVNVEAALAHFIEEYRVDLLAMLTHKRGFFQEMFTYSMTKKLANHLRVPLLAYQYDAHRS